MERLPIKFFSKREEDNMRVEGGGRNKLPSFVLTDDELVERTEKLSVEFDSFVNNIQWKEDNVGCLNNYAYYLSETGQQLDKAEQMSLKTVKAEPKNATFLDTYAWILFRQKRYTEAKIYIDQTLQCDSDTSAVLLEHAGDIYYHVGNKQQAVEYWKQALERTRQTVGSEDNRLKIIARKIKLKKYVKE